jgi:nucleolar MIF4G domain-containing protein 1
MEKYVPPHVRGSILNEDPKKQEQLKRLRRQMKGLLNRLAENNMTSIALQVKTSTHSA